MELSNGAKVFACMYVCLYVLLLLLLFVSCFCLLFIFCLSVHILLPEF